MMDIIRASADMRARSDAWRREGKTIGFVPTMGAFHEGHLSLIRRARSECDVVIVSLFVNPTQFNDPADLAAYPRTEDSDAEGARAAGADALFMPGVEDMYPRGAATSIAVGGIESILEGAMRGPQHFRGVATVVARLLNVVAPDVLYLGQKDAQQVGVIRRMISDLGFPVRVQVCPTVRESDGLAMSSRNVRLSADERQKALALRHGLDAAGATVERGERSAAVIEEAVRAVMLRDGIQPEYVAVVNPETFETMDLVSGEVLVAIAARVGPVRLIDNERLQVP